MSSEDADLACQMQHTAGRKSLLPCREKARDLPPPCSSEQPLLPFGSHPQPLYLSLYCRPCFQLVRNHSHTEKEKIRNHLMVHTHVKHGETRGGKVPASATQQGGAELGSEPRSLDPAGCFLGSLKTPEKESRVSKSWTDLGLNPDLLTGWF